AVNEREAIAKELAHEERLASLGRLASGMAHEINNPLGGLFNAIDTLKAHGDKAVVRRSSLDLIERGLKGIRDVVRSALATYRADRDPRLATAEDFDDLKLLVRPEANRRAIALGWHVVVEGPCPLAASALRQVVLNLLLNAIQATAEGGKVEFCASRDANGALELEVHDQGPGFTPEARAVLLGHAPVPSPLGTGSGLGLWMTYRLTSEVGGAVEIEPSPLGGTLVKLCFPGLAAQEERDVA
ncbi:hypothetical protein B6S44_27350, partial [Bosea sp. Tri-44]|uniref:sensor histidine kinase n=1 Tax=Bosea sp. Tri-44 TaxID=1972137 RepID=UPI001026D291